MKNNLCWQNKLKITLVLAGGTLIIASFAVGAALATPARFMVFPARFFIGDVPVGGLNNVAAEKLVRARWQQIERAGLTVVHPEIGARRLSLQVDGESVFVFDADQTLSAARQLAGRSKLVAVISSFFGARSNSVPFVVSARSQTKNLLQKNITALGLNLFAPVDAGFEINFVAGRPHITVRSEVIGRSIDFEQLITDATRALSGPIPRVNVLITEQRPAITTAAVIDLLPSATALAEQINVGRILTIEGKKININADDLLKLLQPRLLNGEIVIRIDPIELQTRLRAALTEFEQSGSNAEFIIKDKRVIKFVPQQTGVVIDWDATADRLFASLNTASTIVPIKTKEIEPDVTLSKLNDLGINELLGSGKSDFTGSPKNRIHNITVGVNALNGLLVAPDETFSLLKALGKIDASSGYLEELVIKENKTKPEFGGGLCQIGTTTFRAAMGAGFPIVERRNHSYQVSYYFENGVSGTDATIYEPKPDFRFKNDTGHWVMLRAQKIGNTLVFSFWGTRDGRKAERTIPKVLSRTPPPPKQTIETTDLSPGKVKCTEKAHVGASTIFTYMITYSNGEIKKEDFSSYYKPWGEVCLVGVAPTSTPMVNPDATALPTTADTAGVSGN